MIKKSNHLIIHTVFAALARARDFLPMLAKANESLKIEMMQRPATDFDLEHVDEQQPYIEMVLR